MTFNTTSVTGGSSLSNITASKNISSYQGLRTDSANNLGYGLGRIARSAFEQIYQAYQRLCVSEPSPEENAMHKQITIFRNGLMECVQKLNATLDNLHPYDPSKLAKIQSLVMHCADYLKPQEKAEFQAFQKKALQPLEAKISKIAHPHIRKALRQLLLQMFQQKNPGEAQQEKSSFVKTKRAAQQAGAWPATFDLSTLDGTNGFVVSGIAPTGELGASVRTAGDLNGDGKADLVLGARSAFSKIGEVYVLFGQAAGWPASFNLTTLNGTNGFVVPGIVASSQLGYSVSTAGDLNGDGKADLVLGAPGNSTTAGVAYVLFGQTGGWPASFNLRILNGTNGFAVPGIAPGDALGFLVSTAGDLNGDGKVDLVLGSHGLNSQTGVAYILFGQTSGWPPSFDVGTLNGTNGFVVPGISLGGRLGYAVSTAGDLNDDGKDDLVLGAWSTSAQTGAAYVLFGQASGWPASFNLSLLNGTNGFAVPGIVTSGYLGGSVSTAGDFNGDGKDDLILGANRVSSYAGAVYVLFGRASGWPASFNLATLNGTNGFVIPGIAAAGQLGYPVSTAGDLNGDGKADLVLGAQRVSSNIGTNYVLFGQAGEWPASLNLTTLNGTNGFAVPGIAAPGYLGVDASTAGDLNGDAITDLVLGAYGVSSNTGAAYILFGKNSSEIALTPITIVVNIPTNLNTTFVPLTAGILSLSNNTVTVRLVDDQGYAIVFTSNSSAVPLSTPFSPLEVTGFSIARGNATAGAVPVFEGCNAGGQCILSNATTPLGEVFTTEGVDWKIVVPIVVSVAAVAIGGGLIFYFAYYRKKNQNKNEVTPSTTAKLVTRVKK